jgi:hypothetical protein
MGRKPNGASTVYHGSDGDWHGRVTVGTKPDPSLSRLDETAVDQGILFLDGHEERSSA